MSAINVDPYDLGRFVTAQSGNYDSALAELRSGKKRTHWMWFIFPQVLGLGTSHMADRYAVRSRAEAEAFIAHPVLGARLIGCAEALLSVSGRTSEEIMGYPDCLKLKSSMTLFAQVSGAGSVFHRVLDTYFDGAGDLKTLDFLNDNVHLA